MKRTLLLALLSFSLLGCSTQNTSIKETNIVPIYGLHTRIKGNESLEYIATIPADYYSNYDNAASSGTLKIQKYYLFLGKSAKDTDKVFIVRHIESVSGIFTGGMYDYEDAIALGAERVGSITYETITEMASLPIPVQRFLSDSGFTPKNRYIVKRLGRLGGPGDKHIWEIAYYESLDVSKTKRKDWETPSSLSEAQKAYLAEFEQRASQSFALAE